MLLWTLGNTISRYLYRVSRISVRYAIDGLVVGSAAGIDIISLLFWLHKRGLMSHLVDSGAHSNVSPSEQKDQKRRSCGCCPDSTHYASTVSCMMRLGSETDGPFTESLLLTAGAPRENATFFSHRASCRRSRMVLCPTSYADARSPPSPTDADSSPRGCYYPTWSEDPPAVVQHAERAYNCPPPREAQGAMIEC